MLRVNEAIAERPNGTEATPVGSPEQVAEALPRLAELGVTEVLWAMQIPVDEQLARMERLIAPT